jgi:hypothetical protein
LPGLGQAYNKKYWKIPLYMVPLGLDLYFYLNSNKKYNQYRDAYKRRLEGYSDELRLSRYFEINSGSKV